nr:bacteriohopanetetrol glucosamine biosynthesis glycosyltransferase HpnI [Acidisarcina polymorpha]
MHPLLILTAISKGLFIIALIGLVSSSVYAALVTLAAFGFAHRRQRRLRQNISFSPALSLLKPLHGREPDLEQRLEGFFRQDYPSYEILFCAREGDDLGLQVARRVAQKYPHIPVQFLTTGEPAYTNAKVSSLELMADAAHADILVISDSDVRVTPEYLREVAAPFADNRIGLATCLYRGIADGKSFWSRLEATAMSIEMAAGVLVADRIEGMQFALGPTMAVRRECVQEIGGFGTLGRYCADDFVLGNRIAARGHSVVLSDHVIDHIVLNEGFWQSMKHQVRWMKSTRFSRPKGHFGTALTFSVPFGFLMCVACTALGSPVLGLSALIWSISTRMLLAAVVGKTVVKERSLLRTMLLYPIRDLMGFGFWAVSYASNRILWRGEIFELLRDGVMRRYLPEASAARIGEETLLPPRA